jgi:hypothetical protein
MAERRRAWETEISRLLAERMNTSVNDDIRPAVVASVAVSCAVTVLAWNLGMRRQGGSVPAVSTEDAFAALQEIITGR